MQKIIFIIFGFAISVSALAGGIDLGDCTTLDQSGYRDYMKCPNPAKEVRCYARVQTEEGVEVTVYGRGCYAEFSDCWWNGRGAVRVCP